MMRTRLLVLLLAAASAFAQLDAAPDNGTSNQLVEIAPPNTVTVSGKKPGKLVVEFRIKNGLHINSNQPLSRFIIPTKLTFTSLPRGIRAGKVTYPAGQQIALDIAPDEKLSVYSGDVTLAASLLGGAAAKSGTYPAKAQLQYQACDNRMCYPPKTAPIDFQVKVGK